MDKEPGLLAFAMSRYWNMDGVRSTFLTNATHGAYVWIWVRWGEKEKGGKAVADQETHPSPAMQDRIEQTRAVRAVCPFSYGSPIEDQARSRQTEPKSTLCMMAGTWYRRVEHEICCQDEIVSDPKCKHTELWFGEGTCADRTGLLSFQRT